ncbi:MAG TPA: homoaconitate hydratase, partial [Geobacteraceae bacterium]
VVGKHSGTSGLVERYRQLGVELSRDEAARLMDTVRATAQRLKRPLSNRDLTTLYAATGTTRQAA